MALTALLQGPFEEGNRVLGKEGVLEIILAMADSNDAIHTVGRYFKIQGRFNSFKCSLVLNLEITVQNDTRLKNVPLLKSAKPKYCWLFCVIMSYVKMNRNICPKVSFKMKTEGEKYAWTHSY